MFIIDPYKYKITAPTSGSYVLVTLSGGDPGTCCDATNWAALGKEKNGNDITPNQAYTIDRVDFRIGSITGDISTIGFKVEVRDMVGSDLTTLVDISNETTNLQVGWNSFIFSSPVTLASGSKYGIACVRTDVSWSAENHPNLPYQDVNWTNGEIASSSYWSAAGVRTWDYAAEWSIRLYQYVAS